MHIFLKSMWQDRFFLYLTWPILRRKKFPAYLDTDRKTSNALQLEEKHFTALVIFQNSFLLGLTEYFWPLIFILYRMTMVNIQCIDTTLKFIIWVVATLSCQNASCCGCQLIYNILSLDIWSQWSNLILYNII
jgi:hypothetical protein